MDRRRRQPRSWGSMRHTLHQTLLRDQCVNDLIFTDERLSRYPIIHTDSRISPVGQML